MDDQRFLQACKLRDEGRREQAIQEFLKIAQITQDPVDKAGVLLNAATTLKALGDYDEARRQLNEARDLFAHLKFRTHEGRRDSRVPQLKLGLEFEEADIYSFEGRIEEALSKFDQAFNEVVNYDLGLPEFRESYEMIQTRRAFILGDLGRCKEAIPILEEAESFENLNAEIFFYLGHCYLALRDYSKAKEKLILALEMGLPQRLRYRAYCELGIAYFRLNDYAKALVEFKKSAETADEEYTREAQIWRWLEESSRALGLDDQANGYSKLASGPETRQ